MTLRDDLFSRKSLSIIVTMLLLLLLAAIFLMGADSVPLPPVPRGNSIDGPVENRSEPTPIVIGDADYVIAAADSSAEAKALARAVCDGTDDQKEINDAFASLGASGGRVLLLKGTYTCSDNIVPVKNSALEGQGTGHTILVIRGYYKNIRISVPYVTVSNLAVTGDGWILITNSHVLIRNVQIADANTAVHPGHDDIGANAAFFVWAQDRTIQDIEFNGCTAKNVGVHGFGNGGAGDIKMIRNIRYIDCQAIHCGGYVSNEIIAWTTGFDLREDNDIEDCIVIRCQAIDNWESGFHFEPRYAARIRMEDCVSSGNGQRKLQAIGMLESDENPRGLFFGSGFFVHLDAELINCTAENNVVSGFWTWGGDYVFFTRCRDNGSGDGFRITHNSQDITYDDCTSQNSRGYALYAWNCHDLVFRNFSISSPEGENGRCISLGLREGAADIYPVQSSSFDMHVSGGKSPTVLYIHQGMDLSFSGSIDTAQPYPVVISGVTTKNIRFQDFSILSSGGQAGITVESGVRDAGSIWVINSLIEGKEKPLQAGIVNNAAAPVVTTGLTIRGANVACTKCSTSP